MKNNTNIILFIITLFMNNSNKQVGTKGAHIRDNIIEFIEKIKCPEHRNKKVCKAGNPKGNSNISAKSAEESS